MENAFACANCCEAALAAAPRDASATETDGGVTFGCEASANGFGQTCGYRGVFTCACKTQTTSAATSLCSSKSWAPAVIAQVAARGASIDTS